MSMKHGLSRRAAVADVDRAAAVDLAVAAGAEAAAADRVNGGNPAGRFEHQMSEGPADWSAAICLKPVCGVK